MKAIIDWRYQGHGYGAEAVRQVAELVRAGGATELLTSYVPEDGGPAAFYQRLGFVPTGELDRNGEVIVRLALPRHTQPAARRHELLDPRETTNLRHSCARRPPLS